MISPSLSQISLPALEPLSEAEEFAKPQVAYDLLIVGGGIVGMTLACALYRSGLKVAIVEAQSHEVQASRDRAYAVTLGTKDVLSQLGIWDSVQSQIGFFNQIHLSDGDYPGIVEFQPQDLGRDDLGYVAPHSVLALALQRRLAQLESVTWLCPATVEAIAYHADRAAVTLTVNGSTQTLNTRLVVAADGPRSQTRTAAGVNTYGWAYWQSCITCVVCPERSHSYTAYECFHASGPFAILPLPNNLCQIVWTAPHEEAKAFAALDDQDFLAALQQRFGHQMGALTLVGDRWVFPVQLRQSDRYTRSRLALVGDAAHCCHPVGGQGLNLGIRDAAVLAEVLQAAHDRGEDLGSQAVLSRYDRQRWFENLVILGFTDMLNRTFSNTWLPAVVVRRWGLWVLRNVPPVKSLALRLMTGLLWRSPKLTAS